MFNFFRKKSKPQSSTPISAEKELQVLKNTIIRELGGYIDSRCSSHFDLSKNVLHPNDYKADRIITSNNFVYRGLDEVAGKVEEVSHFGDSYNTESVERTVGLYDRGQGKSGYFLAETREAITDTTLYISMKNPFYNSKLTLDRVLLADRLRHNLSGQSASLDVHALSRLVATAKDENENLSLKAGKGLARNSALNKKLDKALKLLTAFETKHGLNSGPSSQKNGF